jgi:hypothetical protein
VAFANHHRPHDVANAAGSHLDEILAECPFKVSYRRAMVELGPGIYERLVTANASTPTGDTSPRPTRRRRQPSPSESGDSSTC